MRPNQERPPVELSVIIPALNEERSIGATLDAVADLPDPIEVIVVDGGSPDRTVEMARERGVRVISADRGRGPQMHAGASVASAELLWFLHADTIPPAGAARQIIDAFQDPEIVLGNFAIKFDGPRLAARFLTWLYPHLRKVGLCYGDSAIFVRRETYERVGGFSQFPIFEDLDLIRKLRRLGRMVHLPGAVVSSSRRFEERGFALTFARWSVMQVLYWSGVNPRVIGRYYAPIRTARPLETAKTGAASRRPAKPVETVGERTGGSSVA